MGTDALDLAPVSLQLRSTDVGQNYRGKGRFTFDSPLTGCQSRPFQTAELNGEIALGESRGRLKVPEVGLFVCREDR
jgi:hypothetical protein